MTTSPSASSLSPGDDAAEVAWIAAAQKGDGTAFGHLYHRCAPRVFALLCRLAGDESAASDLLQETFFQAWRGLPAWRGDSTLATWLHSIAVNAHLAALRKSRTREAHETAVDEIDKLAGIAAPASDTGARLDLERAIGALPPRMRTAFVLRDVEGYSYDEVAAVTATAPSTVRVQVSRARVILSRLLNR
jgi:RNA polymerase sigma factor (sigma-70 family)